MECIYHYACSCSIHYYCGPGSDFVSGTGKCSIIRQCHVYYSILKNVDEDLAAAVDALKNNNVTGAVNEASLTHTDWRDALNFN
jgi:hypothetical protein